MAEQDARTATTLMQLQDKANQTEAARADEVNRELLDVERWKRAWQNGANSNLTDTFCDSAPTRARPNDIEGCRRAISNAVSIELDRIFQVAADKCAGRFAATGRRNRCVVEVPTELMQRSALVSPIDVDRRRRLCTDTCNNTLGPALQQRALAMKLANTILRNYEACVAAAIKRSKHGEPGVDPRYCPPVNEQCYRLNKCEWLRKYSGEVCGACWGYP